MSADLPICPKKHSRGFTLVELLVVAGTLALLIGMLLPAMVRARASAAGVACASNLGQWAHALHMYANQERGWLPRRGQGQQPTTEIDRPDAWFNALPPMLRIKTYAQLVDDGRAPRPGVAAPSIWMCPGAVDRGEKYFFAYGMNMWISPTQSAAPDRINRIGPWSSAVFMADGPGSHCALLPAAADYSPVARHRGRVNIGFVDGHVASYTAAEVGCGLGDPKRPDVRWIVPGSSWAGPKVK